MSDTDRQPDAAPPRLKRGLATIAVAECLFTDNVKELYILAKAQAEELDRWREAGDASNAVPVSSPSAPSRDAVLNAMRYVRGGMSAAAAYAPNLMGDFSAIQQCLQRALKESAAPQVEPQHAPARDAVGKPPAAAATPTGDDARDAARLDWIDTLAGSGFDHIGHGDYRYYVHGKGYANVREVIDAAMQRTDQRQRT